MEATHRTPQWRWFAAGGLLTAVFLGVRTGSYHFWNISLPNALQDLLTLTFSIIIESLPFVLLGVLLAVVIRVWLPKAATAWLPKNPTLRRLYISLLGVFLPVCECGNVPLARGLLIKGFTPAESITFLLAAPILNPITLITTHQAFQADARIVIIRALGALLIANIIGWLYSAYRNQDKLLTEKFLATCKAEKPHKHDRVNHGLSVFGKEMGTILPALLLGSLLAGLIQVLVPRDVLLTLGSNPGLSILVMMLLAFVISICSNVDAFFALAFSNTFSVGSLVSFLVFGPMIDIKMLSLMRTTYKGWVLAQLAALVALMSMAIGLVVNYAF
jgi:uncharacterized membrane protein YraQ (UPF0718 family)